MTQLTDTYIRKSGPTNLTIWNIEKHRNDVIMSAMASQISARRLECLFNRLFRPRSKKTSKLRVTGLCVGITRKWFHLMTSSWKNMDVVDKSARWCPYSTKFCNNILLNDSTYKYFNVCDDALWWFGYRLFLNHPWSILDGNFLPRQLMSDNPARCGRYWSNSGLRSVIFPISPLSIHWLTMDSCGDTHQIWKWFKDPNRYFSKIKLP